MTYTSEADFESALIGLLPSKGWESGTLQNCTEQDLIQNWARILFDNNKGIDRLNNCPLTEGEMGQIMEQIHTLRTPLKLNGFINGKTVSVIRDNVSDTLHLGKEVSLKIYDRREIAAGQSRYQIVRQPRFSASSRIRHERRGDVLLLINGMPVIHIELKREGIPVSEACRQIEKYAHERIFTGLFSLVQVFVAMTPAETRYFANPGPDGVFNPDYYFKWADFNNEPMYCWKDVVSSLLSIPMAHQLIGFYTVADDSDGILKVMRSYQYYAASAISDKVSRTVWKDDKQRGGFVWHTTGSGKTMTSFKSAQLIAHSKDADKVVFLIDRIELGTQSLEEYRSFAEENESVQATENTDILVAKLKSVNPADTLIVTSIHKMSRIKDEGDLKAADIALINARRLVFIVDECHRSTFGEMLITIKQTFPAAIFFGFTGTPIHEENSKKLNTTVSVFGDELHRYSIADGLRDKNVLGFDTYKVTTFADSDVRRVVALFKAKVADEAEALADPHKREVFYRFMDGGAVKMAGYTDSAGNYIKGIEDYLPSSQYESDVHKDMVVKDIAVNWLTVSRGGKFHALFATSSIAEAIEYYRLLKKQLPTLKTTCLFDPNIDNTGGFAYKEDGLIEIVSDYNERYGQNFTLASYGVFKKDITSRLAHKDQYKLIDRSPESQLDMLVVVDQMLTGFDSKWINALYLDKVLVYESVIQAFSRTNRLFGEEKPFGIIRYYRRPHTMEENIKAAVKLYSGDKPFDLFVPKLEEHLHKMNEVFCEITTLFKKADVSSFEKLPEEPAARGKFASLFRSFSEYLEAAKVQGFSFDKPVYTFTHEDGAPETSIRVEYDETAYLTLALRYKELSGHAEPGDGSGDDVPFELAGYLCALDTSRIDKDYMNSRFDKYLKLLQQPGVDSALVESALSDLHKSFAVLTQEEQKYANIFLHDIQRGDAAVEPGKTLRDYITEYRGRAKTGQIRRLAAVFGLNEIALEALMRAQVTEDTLNEFGRFDNLKSSADMAKVKEYFEKTEKIPIPAFKAHIKLDVLLRDFIASGGFDIAAPEDGTVTPA